jgi:hypothetical protein
MYLNFSRVFDLRLIKGARGSVKEGMIPRAGRSGDGDSDTAGPSWLRNAAAEMTREEARIVTNDR